MTCTTRFDLHSMKIDLFSMSYHKEEYQMPCAHAIAFLRQLDLNYSTAKSPLHKVTYTVTDDRSAYTSKMSETPLKAAAKIELFMNNSSLLPKKE